MALTSQDTQTKPVVMDSPEDIALADRMNAGRKQIEAEIAKLIVGQQDSEITVNQHIAVPAQRIQGLIVREQALVGRAAAILPRVGAAVIRIIIARHAHFIAIENGRCTGHGELDQ